MSALVSLWDPAPGTRILVDLPNGPALADALRGCWRSGWVAVPADPRWPAAQRRFVAEHAAVAGEWTADGLRRTRSGAPLVAEGDAFVVYTSGSTGDPKGVVLPRSAVEYNARATGVRHGFADGTPHGTCLPLYHCNALVMSLVGTELFGNELVLHAPFDPVGYFRQLAAAGATTASIVPALLEALVRAAPPWPSSLRYLVTAAAPLSPDLARRFHAKYGPRLVQGYGLSEAVNFSFVMPTLDDAAFRRAYLDGQPPVGEPLPGTEARIVDGEVQIRAPGFREYWRNLAATEAARTEDGWLRTGDRGEWVDGWLVLRGRSREVVKRGGETLYPVDVEEEWRRCGVSAPVCAHAVPADLLGEEVGGWFPDAIEPGPLLAALARSVWRPATGQVGPLPATSTGKPQRARMTSRSTCRIEPAADYAGLLAHAHRVARRIAAEPAPRPGPARFVHAAAEDLARCAIEGAPTPPSAGSRALDLLDARWSDLAAGMRGEDIVRDAPGLWTALMREWPMGGYAQLAADFLRRRDLLGGRVLELGAGVGNTTLLVRDAVGTGYIRTDLHPQLVARVDAPGEIARYDFDEPGPWRDLDAVFAVNAVHCCRDKRRTVGHLRDMLRDGGTLLLAEGAPTTAPGVPWALHGLFGLFDGWWDVGGFVPRQEWLEHFVGAGFRAWGWATLRSGRHDLGGLVWATR